MPPTDDQSSYDTSNVSGGPQAMHSSASHGHPPADVSSRVSGVKREHSSSPDRRNAGGSAPSAPSEQQHANTDRNHTPTHLDPSDDVDDGEEDDDEDDEDYAESDDPSHLEASQTADSNATSDGPYAGNGTSSHEGIGSTFRPFGKKPRNKRRRVEDISEHEIWKCLFAPCTKIYKRTSTISIHNHRNSCRYRPLRANMITNPAAIHNISTANTVSSSGGVVGGMYATAVNSNSMVDPSASYYHHAAAAAAAAASAYPHMTQAHAPADYYSHYASMYAQSSSSSHQVLPYPLLPPNPGAAHTHAQPTNGFANNTGAQAAPSAVYSSHAVGAASAAAAAAAAAAHMSTAFPSEIDGASESSVKQAQAQAAAVQAQVELHHMQQRQQAQQAQQQAVAAAAAGPHHPHMYSYQSNAGAAYHQHQQYAYQQQHIAQQRQQLMQHLPPQSHTNQSYHYMHPYGMVAHAGPAGEAFHAAAQYHGASQPVYSYSVGIAQPAPVAPPANGFASLPVAIPVSSSSNPALSSASATPIGTSPPAAATTTTTTTTTTIHTATPVAPSSTSPNMGGIPPLSMNSPLSLTGGSTPMSLSTAVFSIGTPPHRAPQVMVRTTSTSLPSPALSAATVSNGSWSAFKSVNPNLPKQGTSPVNPALQPMLQLKAAAPLVVPSLHQPMLSSTPGEAAHEAWLEHMRSRVDGIKDAKTDSSTAKVKPTSAPSTPTEAAETITAIKSE